MHKLIFMLVAFFFLGIIPAKANDIYVAQSAAGAASGADCAGAYASSFFNSKANWGTGSNQIGPGTTVHLCGTITSELIFQGSGTSGNNIVLKFESGANMTSAVWNPEAISLNAQNYITIDGGTPCGPGTSCSSSQTGTGTIQNTANGTALANQVASNLISGSTNAGNSCGHDIEIKNLLLLNAYIKTNGTIDNSAGASSSNGVRFVGCGSNIYIHDLTSTWGHTNIGISTSGAPTNWDISNTVTQHSTWGILMALNSSPAVPTNWKIHDNDVNIGSEWNQTDDNYHMDGIFVYGQNSTGYANGIYIYNNYLHGNWGNGAEITAYVYANQNLNNLYIFNNVFQIPAGFISNGFICTGYGNTSQFLFNNTFVGYSSTSGTYPMTDTTANAVASTTIENNVIYNTNGAFYYFHGGNSSLAAVDYNDYYGTSGSGTSGAWCASNCTSTFSTWQSYGFDANGSAGNPNLNSSFIPQSGSAAIGRGKNLYSICNGQPNPGLGALCYDKGGNARLSSGMWDAGAYNHSGTSSSTVQPPTNLGAVVQ